jgi:PleD family two-component response regulator
MPSANYTKILLIDPLESMRNVTCSLIQLHGNRKVFQAKDSLEALYILKHEPINAIISSWNIFDMDGLELLKSVRKNPNLCHLPFILMTVETERRNIEEAIAQGVSGFLVRPYSATSLNEQIEKAMRWKPRFISTTATASLPLKPTRSTILIVDDTADNLHLLSNIFKEDYRVLVINNGKQALEICASDTPPDLVLLDIMMPDMNGFEVAKRMRVHPNSEHIPVIFITSMTSDDARMRGLELGAVDFVTKPIDPNVLKPRVRNFLRYVELHKQLQSNYDVMLENARLHEEIEQLTQNGLKEQLENMRSSLQNFVETNDLLTKQVNQILFIDELTLQALNTITSSVEFHKIKTGVFELNAQPVKICDILRRIVEIYRCTFSTKNLTILLDTDTTFVGEQPPKSLGDATLCYSLFQSLIENACEVAPKKSEVSVVLFNENPLRITIQNKGIVSAQIQEGFFSNADMSNKSNGTNYSAKLLTEVQEGHISLAVSLLEKTTTITVDLPRFLDA